MQPIVHGLEARYGQCVQFTRANILAESPLRARLRPFGTPEFYLLEADGTLIQRWFGVTTRAEFEAALRPRCTVS
jgi:hypothetical protein